MPDKHDLHAEFPEYKEQIHQLKQNNNHFAVLFNRYHEIDREIHRIEQGISVCSDDYLEQQKVQRLHLKDDLFTMLKAAEATV
jgi:uncharacterized protein YdcH (DUF465 family)